MFVKCVVTAHNAAGEPDFYFCVVRCNDEQYDSGDYADIAAARALEAGYEAPMVVFEETPSLKWLFDHFVWESATVFNT